MRKQRRSYLLSILFILSIVVGAWHTMGHAHAQSDHCQICIVKKLSPGDVDITVSREPLLFSFISEDFKAYTFDTKAPLSRPHSRAPPVFL